MCGRIRCQSKTSSILSNYKSSNNNEQADLSLYLSENILPGTVLNVLRYCNQSNKITIDNMIWGLIPSSYKQKDIKPNHFLMYNCRVENAAQKISFKHLIQNNNNNKCILIIDGYYEWKEEFGQKQPYYITTTTDTPLYLAGIYDTIIHNNEQLKTFTIFTMNSITSTMKYIHNRQPIFLSEDQIGTWLSTTTNTMMFLQSYIDCSISLSQSHSTGNSSSSSSHTDCTIIHTDTTYNDTSADITSSTTTDTMSFLQPYIECSLSLSQSHSSSSTGTNTNDTIAHTDSIYNNTNTDTPSNISILPPDLYNICTNNIQYYPVTKQVNHASYQGSDSSIKCMMTKKQVKINDYFSVTPSPKKQKSMVSTHNSSVVDSKVGRCSEGSVFNMPNKKTKLYDTYDTTTTAIPSSSSSSSSACTIPAASSTTNTQPDVIHDTHGPTLLSDTNTVVFSDRSPKNEASPSPHNAIGNNAISNNSTSKRNNNSCSSVYVPIDSIIDLTDD